jgi:RNA polymerase sigma-70 factor (ECF subfamily)
MLAALDGEITTTEREALAAHLSGCEACRAEAGATRRMHQALEALPQATEMPTGLEQAALRRVRAVLAEEDAAAAAPGWSWWWVSAPLAAAVAVVALWRVPPGPEPAPPAEVVAARPAAPPEAGVATASRRAEPRAAAGEAAPVPPPPPQVAEALDLFLDMPILENMEKLENFDAIRTVDVGDDARSGGGRG